MFNEILDKKPDEVTMRDQLKFAIVATAVTAAVPIVMMGTVAGVSSLAAKIKEAKNKKNIEELEK